MSHPNTRPSDADQGVQLALPPFAGPTRPRPDAPLRRAVRRLAGRQTLPPFFMPVVTVGGPLPGARRPAPQPVAGSSYEAPSLETTARIDAVAHAEPAVEAPVLGEADPVGVVDSLLPDAEADPAGLDAAPSAETADPWITDYVAVDPAATPPTETFAVPAPDLSSDDLMVGPDLAMETRPTLNHSSEREDNLEDQSDGFGADLFEQPFLREAQAAAPPPPTYFEGELPPNTEFADDLSVDALRAMFGEAYTDEPQVSGEVLDPRSPEPTESRAELTTPVFSAPPIPPPRGYRSSGAFRHRTSGGASNRRPTPVMGSRAITPLSTPVIPLHPGMPRVAAGMSPTPVSVPIMADFEGSRAVVHALESVASQIRIGHLVVVGTVPRGDDVASLAAGLAAALAALLGVQQ